MATDKKKVQVHKLNPKRRKKLLQEKQQTEGVSEDEIKRRERQKRLRALAVQLRATGRTYRGPWQLDKKRRPEGAAEGSQKSKRPKTPAPQVIVLPIFWNSREDEKERVLKAAELAVQLLHDAALDATLDTDDTHTPGQRMKFWEMRGVKVRLEVGPKEAQAGNVILAIAKAPGEVADKRSVRNIEAKLPGAVKRALRDNGQEIRWTRPKEGAAAGQAGDGEAGGDAAAEEGAAGVSEGGAAAAEGREKKGKRAVAGRPGDAEGAAAVAEAVEAASASAAGGKKKLMGQPKQQQPKGGAAAAAAATGAPTPAVASSSKPGGAATAGTAAAKVQNPDALEDDFGAEAAAGADSQAGAKKKGKWAKLKEKKRAKAAGGGGGGDEGAGGGGGGGGGAANETKVVTF